MNDNFCLIPSSQVAATIVDGQVVVVLADSGQVTVFNDVGSRIWELCDGKHTIKSLIEIIAEEYDVDPGQARADVKAFLDRLVEIQAIIIKECN